MEEILKQILAELQYQTKLMEDIFENKDLAQKTRALKANMTVLEKQILSNPAIAGNSEMQGIVKNIMNMIPT